MEISWIHYDYSKAHNLNVAISHNGTVYAVKSTLTQKQINEIIIKNRDYLNTLLETRNALYTFPTLDGYTDVSFDSKSLESAIRICILFGFEMNVKYIELVDPSTGKKDIAYSIEKALFLLESSK